MKQCKKTLTSDLFPTGRDFLITKWYMPIQKLYVQGIKQNTNIQQEKKNK